MSAEIVAVLVVPAEGDPGGLLAPGACGSVPPSAWVRRYGRGARWTPGLSGHRTPGDALPLWWDGALVPEGWDRARRVGISVWNNEPNPDLGTVLVCATSLCDRGWGARVVRLARVDGRLVEVEP